MALQVRTKSPTILRIFCGAQPSWHCVHQRSYNVLGTLALTRPALKDRESEAKVASVYAELCQDIVAIVRYRVYLINEGAFANTS